MYETLFEIYDQALSLWQESYEGIDLKMLEMSERLLRASRFFDANVLLSVYDHELTEFAETKQLVSDEDMKMSEFCAKQLRIMQTLVQAMPTK